MDIAIAALNEVASRDGTRATSTAFDAASRPEHVEHLGSNATTILGDNTKKQSTPSNHSQTTLDASTPPTSEDIAPQSHEWQSHSVARSQPHTQRSTTAREQTPSATVAGQKRTYEDFRKPSVSSLTGSPGRPERGHARSGSFDKIAASGLNARELTSELRTRLTYAMVKVNKGWESLPLDEIESLASQRGSPGSSSSTLIGRGYNGTSPRAAIASMQRRLNVNHQGHNGSLASSSQEEGLLHADSQPSRTYESFWAQQNQKTAPMQPIISPSSMDSSLAPPVDVNSSLRQSSNFRRLQSPRYDQTPLLHSQASSDLSQVSQSLPTAPAPHTPSKRRNYELQTPAQKSIQEQDAIETLLFMSSPGNSGNSHAFLSSSQPQLLQSQSPLRGEFRSSYHEGGARKVEFANDVEFAARTSSNLSKESKTPLSVRKSLNLGFKKISPEEIDQMLDKVDDDDSSDDEIEIPLTPRRLAASKA